MSRFTQYVFKDTKYTAEDKTAVYDLICDGPKTVSEIAEATGMDNMHVSYICRNIEGYGAIMKAGRYRGKVVYEVKA